MTETEQNWPQINKELLAIVYGFEKFHSYVYGRAIDVQTDHNPLVTIIEQALHKASPRLQRLLLRPMKYQTKKVSYVPGKYLYLADTLSRAYPGDETGEYEEDVVMVHTVQIREDQKDQLTAAYASDEALVQLRSAILKGWHWPTKKLVPEKLVPFWNVRAELYIKEDFIYRGEQLVIPVSLRRQYLHILHRGHLGILKCAGRARQYMFWPGMSAEIKEMVSTCHTCQRHANQQQKEPLIHHEIPELPWNKLGMDIMEFQNMAYLVVVVVDFYSHYPEIRLIPQKRAEDVVEAFKSIFAVHGVPTTIIADNMPFSSELMQQFAKRWSFSIVTSSPYYPRSNGMAERYVQTIKLFLKKAADSGGDIYESLLAYRQTPVTGLPFSPAEMLFSRSIRGPLPCTSEKLQPVVPPALAAVQSRQVEQKEKHDRAANHREPLTTGTNVLMRTSKTDSWKPGTIVSQHEQPRSYIVDNGSNLVRRNRVQMKPLLTDSNEDPPVEDISSTPTPVAESPARSARTTRGTLPLRFLDYQMG